MREQTLCTFIIIHSFVSSFRHLLVPVLLTWELSLLEGELVEPFCKSFPPAGPVLGSLGGCPRPAARPSCDAAGASDAAAGASACFGTNRSATAATRPGSCYAGIRHYSSKNAASVILKFSPRVAHSSQACEDFCQPSFRPKQHRWLLGAKWAIICSFAQIKTEGKSIYALRPLGWKYFS